MLSFDTRGYLKPYKIVESSVEEIKKYLVDGIDSNTRTENFEKYLKYSNDLKKLLGGNPMKQWINGSFVSKKLNPKDIDFVTFIDHSAIKKLNEKLNAFRPGTCWETYGVDAYIIEVYPEKSTMRKFTEMDKAEWLYLFSHSRINRNGKRHEKGFIEIFY